MNKERKEKNVPQSLYMCWINASLLDSCSLHFPFIYILIVHSHEKYILLFASALCLYEAHKVITYTYRTRIAIQYTCIAGIVWVSEWITHAMPPMFLARRTTENNKTHSIELVHKKNEGNVCVFSSVFSLLLKWKNANHSDRILIWNCDEGKGYGRLNWIKSTTSTQ